MTHIEFSAAEVPHSQTKGLSTGEEKRTGLTQDVDRGNRRCGRSQRTMQMRSQKDASIFISPRKFKEKLIFNTRAL